ncbi:BON domain-containing protein [Nitrosomonas cryotolerans]|uniref:BON domain-containing protein n=1 Tax=Nitrosomonas cryotolerans ATCC 49181 TaxID=1131553 RepID=A0A1N6IIX9_9PROT|nr:BON domain-containing protein [Nitrosomonas cryotolerans]SFP89693.1 BON domain-containing protein [Nitrosomonas cryotolerans]SIO31951.1 BON domain-containing protein [Nitrosomonas cryotolerans ATCC 49181]
MPIYNKFFMLSIILITSLPMMGCGERVHKSWVEPSATPVYDDNSILAKINAAVQSDPDLQNSDIKIEINSGLVSLTGSANSQDQIDRVTMHAWIIDGVKEVDNQVNLQ